jgi:hypothetical protein
MSSAKIAYVIAAHKNPEQVVRLVRRLASDRATFVLHVDRRASSDFDRRMRTGTRDVADVHFVERHRCYWAGFGVVAATLEAFDYLLEGNVGFTHAVLLSGQDYPLRPAGEIERFFASAEGQTFMKCAPLPVPFWTNGGLSRIEYWYLVSRRRVRVRLPWRRTIPGGLAPHGGETWGSFASPMATYIREFVQRNPRYLRFFRHVLHANELFFQTIMMNSPLAPTVVQDDLRYIDWSVDPGPAVLRTPDFERMVDSGKLFARKFDLAVDGKILDQLDAHIDGVHTGSTA